jgi:hypothetical protein
MSLHFTLTLITDENRVSFRNPGNMKALSLCDLAPLAEEAAAIKLHSSNFLGISGVGNRLRSEAPHKGTEEVSVPSCARVERQRRDHSPSFGTADNLWPSSRPLALPRPL